MTGPQDPAAAGRGGCRAGPRRPRTGDRHAENRVRARPADQGRTRRASGPGARRADLRRPGRAHRRHSAPPARSQGRRARPPRSAAGRSARAAVKSGACLIIAAAATWVTALLVSADGHYHGIPGANPSYESWAPLPLLLAFAAVCTAIGILGSAVVTSLEQRRSRRQLPPRPGGHAPGSRAARRHRPWPGSPRPPHRPGPGRPAGSQVTAAPTAYSHPGGPGIPWRGAGRQARSDAGKPAPGPVPPPSPQAGPYVLARTRISARPGAKQGTREHARNPCSASLNPMALKCAPGSPQLQVKWT